MSGSAEALTRIRPQPAASSAVPAQRALTTVLVIDIVDSTRRAAELGDSCWVDLLLAHEAMTSHEVQRFRGRVLSRTGDGAVAVFGQPAAGVRCAQRLARGTRHLGLELRAGLHSGQYERRGRRLGGLVFHIGSRVAALAARNEVLVSEVVRTLVEPDGVACEPRGEHELRGLPGRWPLFAVK